LHERKELKGKGKGKEKNGVVDRERARNVRVLYSFFFLDYLCSKEGYGS